MEKDLPLDAALLDQVELAIMEINVLLPALRDLQQQRAGYESADAVAICDALTEVGRDFLL